MVIKFVNDKGNSVLIKYRDIISVFQMPDKDARVINFLQGTRAMEIWTMESIDSIQERLKEIEYED